MPEKEEDHLTQATRLLEKRREMAEVENALLAEKDVLIFILYRVSKLNDVKLFNVYLKRNFK
jgi:hypothetical protein